MFQEKRRAVAFFQVCLLVSVFMFSALTDTEDESCCSCSSDAGSDHPESLVSRTVRLSQDSAIVERYHDISLSGDPVTLTEKDLAYLRSRLPDSVMIGLQVPRAPGASQPGDLTAQGHWLRTTLRVRDHHYITYDVDLIPRDDLASEITAVFPPAPNTHWQALAPANDDFITSIPTQTTTFTGGWGSLHYVIDFHGDDPCNGCMVKMTFCTPDRVASRAKLMTRFLFKGFKIRNANGLVCVDPVPTIIYLSDAAEPPSSLTAWLSPWGGPVFNATHGPEVEMGYILGHTSSQTETFTLEPIHSEKGWSYEWRDPNGVPITQIEVGPQSTPWGNKNVGVVGTVPTCTLAVDTIHITATSVITPSFQAIATSLVNVVPDPEICPVADVGIAKVVSSRVITAGQSVTFTLTISNHEQTAVDAVVTDTLSPAWAIGDVMLPPGCGRHGNEITCQVTGVPPGTPRTLDIVVRVDSTFSGTLSNRVRVDPAEATDVRFYDNAVGPVTVTVSGGRFLLYLPVSYRSWLGGAP